MRAIITTDPFTGGAIEFLADKIYIWDADAASWVLGGDAGAAAGADKVISVATALVGVSSAAAIPAGAIITRAAFQASAAYSAGATITTTIGGVEAVLSPADSIPESVSTPLFLVDQLTPTAAGGTVDVAVGGAPAAGAGVVFVWYTEPLT
jgi:hypothetical protein